MNIYIIHHHFKKALIKTSFDGKLHKNITNAITNTKAVQYHYKCHLYRHHYSYCDEISNNI